MSRVVLLSGGIHFQLPEGLEMTFREHDILNKTIHDFILWEMNEWVRNKTGLPCHYGASIQEIINAEKKENYY